MEILENIEVLVHKLHFILIETLFKAEKIIFRFNLENDQYISRTNFEHHFSQLF